MEAGDGLGDERVGEAGSAYFPHGLQGELLGRVLDEIAVTAEAPAEGRRSVGMSLSGRLVLCWVRLASGRAAASRGANRLADRNGRSAQRALAFLWLFAQERRGGGMLAILPFWCSPRTTTI